MTTSGRILSRGRRDSALEHVCFDNSAVLESVGSGSDTKDEDMPLNILESVSYADICSAYIIGHAASVQQLAKDVHHQMAQIHITKINLTESDSKLQGLEYATAALKSARKDLVKEYCQFEMDSNSWARFLLNGDEGRFSDGGWPVVYPNEAKEVMSAVSRARQEVQKALGKMY